MPQIDKLLFLEQILFLFCFFIFLAPLTFIIKTEKTIYTIKKSQKLSNKQRLFF